MRLIFMGTPAFAVASLAALATSGEHEIIAVVTQPDRPQGRGHKLVPSPVKDFSLANGFSLYQPTKVKTPEFTAFLQSLQPEIIVVAAYGQLLSQELLDLPKYGCVNVHASLLPKYRGAAPIHYALLNGEKQSGVTIMQMDKGMDTGAILSQATTLITDSMTRGELELLLQKQGAELLLETLRVIASGKAQVIPQQEEQATYTKLLSPAMEVLDWQETATMLANRIRALNPTPGAYTFLPNGKKLKIFRALATEKNSNTAAGTVAAISKRAFFVTCGDGKLLEITEVQPEAKKIMDAQVFLNGRGVSVGVPLGTQRPV